jgi:hypothetical protein
VRDRQQLAYVYFEGAERHARLSSDGKVGADRRFAASGNDE